jgi:sulfite reductase alpha subunit-like flavoprotein
MHAIVEVPVREQIQILGRRLKPTDQLVVHPSNTDENVARALAIFGLTGKEVIECAPKPGAAPSFFDGQKITTRTLFRDVIDLQGVPQRSVLALLANAAGTEADAKALEYMANDLTTSSEYGKLTARGNVFTVLDVLQRFPSVKLTLAQAVTRLPHIQPRFYSNAHDPATSPEKFHLVYHVPVKDGGKHEGLATGHLRRFVPASHNQRLWCTLEPGKTTLPAVSSNALLIGLGSGIGLVKSAIDERAAAKKAGQKVGQTTVIHGFRKTGQDQLFKRELEAYQAEGVIRYVPVASYDVDGKFASPFDRVDTATADWIKADPASEVLYCGVGGSVPSLLASHFARLGVDVNAMGTRYHQEYFTADLDHENLIKRQPAAAEAEVAEGKSSQKQ